MTPVRTPLAIVVVVSASALIAVVALRLGEDAALPLAGLCLSTLLMRSGRPIFAALAASGSVYWDPSSLIAWPGIAGVASEPVGRRRFLTAGVALAAGAIVARSTLVDLASELARLAAAVDHAGIFTAFGYNNTPLAEAWRVAILAAAGHGAVLWALSGRRREPGAGLTEKGIESTIGGVSLALALVAFAPGLKLASGLYVLPLLTLAALGVPALRPVLLVYAGIMALDLYYFLDARSETYRAVPEARTWSSPYRLGSFLWKTAAVAYALKVLTAPFGAGVSAKPDLAKATSFVSGSFRGAVRRGLVGLRESLAAQPDPFRLGRGDRLGLAGITGLTLLLGFSALGKRSLPTPGLPEGLHRYTLEWPAGRAASTIFFQGQSGGVRLTADCNAPATSVTRQNSFDLLAWEVARLPAPCAGSLSLEAHVYGGSRLIALRVVDKTGAAVLPQRVCQESGCRSLAESALAPVMGEGRPTSQDGTVMDEMFNVAPGIGVLKGVVVQTPKDAVHPFLGRALIYASMAAQGVSPFAWRFPSALLGALIPLAAFFLARETTARRSVAWIACFLAAFDGGRLVISRTAFVDAPATLALVCGYTLLFRYLRRSLEGGASSPWPLLCSGIALGAAASMKWYGLFGAPLVALIAAVTIAAQSRGRPREVGRALGRWGLCFGVVPAAIYFSAYLPFVEGDLGALLRSVTDHQGTILTAHLKGAARALAEPHVFSTRVPGWLFSDVSLPIFRVNLEGSIAAIYLLSHPLLSWACLPAIVLALWRRDLRRQPGVLMLIAVTCAHLLPWALVSRTTFSYHFIPASMAATALVAVALRELARWRRSLAVCYGAVYLAIFIVGMPLMYGVSLDRADFARYRVFDSWFNRMKPSAVGYARGEPAGAGREAGERR